MSSMIRNANTAQQTGPPSPAIPRWWAEDGISARIYGNSLNEPVGEFLESLLMGQSGVGEEIEIPTTSAESETNFLGKWLHSLDASPRPMSHIASDYKECVATTESTHSFQWGNPGRGLFIVQRRDSPRQTQTVQRVEAEL